MRIGVHDSDRLALLPVLPEVVGDQDRLCLPGASAPRNREASSGGRRTIASPPSTASDWRRGDCTAKRVKACQYSLSFWPKARLLTAFADFRILGDRD
jgi:hypothetical protein